MVVKSAEPLVDIKSAFLDLRQRGHSDNTVVRLLACLLCPLLTEPIGELAPIVSSVVGIGEIKAVLLSFLPCGTARYHYELLLAAMQLDTIDGRGLFRLLPRLGRNLLGAPILTHIARTSHNYVALAVPLGIHCDELSPVVEHKVGVSEIIGGPIYGNARRMIEIYDRYLSDFAKLDIGDAPQYNQYYAEYYNSGRDCRDRHENTATNMSLTLFLVIFLNYFFKHINIIQYRR